MALRAIPASRTLRVGKPTMPNVGPNDTSTWT
jgi:hypothetical protein